MPRGTVAAKLLIPTGIGAVGGGGVGALLPPEGKTKKERKQQRIANAVALGILGGSMGFTVGAGILEPEDFRSEWDPGNFNWDPGDFNWSHGPRRPPPPPSAGRSEVGNIAVKYGLPEKPKTKEELKRAYRKAAVAWHPDRAKPEDRMKYNAAMSDINRWNEYWVDKVAFWKGFQSELTKLGLSSL